MYYIGLDVHKQKISYCAKDDAGKVFAEGWIRATCIDLDRWMKTLPQPWSTAVGDPTPALLASASGELLAS